MLIEDKAEGSLAAGTWTGPAGVRAVTGLLLVMWLRDCVWRESNRRWFRMGAARFDLYCRRYRVRDASLAYRCLAFCGRLLDRLIQKWGGRC